VQRPFLTVCDAAMGYHLPACLRLLEAAHIPEILHEAGSRGMHVEEIAKRVGALRRAQRRRQVETQDDEGGYSDLEVDPALLGHVLRLLATHHITHEVRPNVFANNRISDAIGSGKSIHELAIAPETKYEGADGIAAFVGMHGRTLQICRVSHRLLPPPLETPTNVSERNGSDSPSSGSGSHPDLADLALGRQLGNSIPSPLANVSVSEPLLCSSPCPATTRLLVLRDAGPTSPITFAESHSSGDEDRDGWGNKRETADAYSRPDSSAFAHDLQRMPQCAPHPPLAPTTPTTTPTMQASLSSVVSFM